MESWKDLSITAIGEDKLCGVATSVEHQDCPINDGFFKIRGQYDIMSHVLEKNPNGDGIKYTQIKRLDMKGSLPDFVNNKLARIMPQMNFKIWKMYLGKVEKG